MYLQLLKFDFSGASFPLCLVSISHSSLLWYHLKIKKEYWSFLVVQQGLIPGPATSACCGKKIIVKIVNLMLRFFFYHKKREIVSQVFTDEKLFKN